MGTREREREKEGWWRKKYEDLRVVVVGGRVSRGLGVTRGVERRVTQVQSSAPACPRAISPPHPRTTKTGSCRATEKKKGKKGGKKRQVGGNNKQTRQWKRQTRGEACCVFLLLLRLFFFLN